MKKTDAYYSGSTLNITVRNSEKFNELLEDVQKKSEDLEESLNKLRNFNLEVNVEVSDD
ncbi:hypothetical protein [Erysipelothrix anatis]|uniref:hypothetical protein n=1 Tax=Erysipelothrix anatis TaxID=2683713 RepID=UPI001359137F|nr:hypothetical protein [Erysipelothrix anatis]